MPTVYIVRHGSTAFNADGRLRGWMDPSLDEEGWEQARNARKLVPEGLTVYTSDLRRAVQTAHMLKSDGKFLFLESSLRPWNVGLFAGQPHSAVDAHLRRLQKDPSLRAPFGESYAEFAARLLGFMRTLRSDCVVVTHYRCCKLVDAWARGGFGGVDVSLIADSELATGVVMEVRLP